jgi:hypothetical protein
MLNSEAPCFILTQREPEKFLAARPILKVGNVVQLFPRCYWRGLLSYSTFKVFSGPPLKNIDGVCASVYVRTKNLNPI